MTHFLRKGKRPVAAAVAAAVVLTGFMRPGILRWDGSCPVLVCAGEKKADEDLKELTAEYEDYRRRFESIENQSDIGRSGFRVIEDQIFPIETRSFGEVWLVPALDEKYSRLALFFTKADGTVTIKGLEDDTDREYFFEEVVAPSGYSLNSEPAKINSWKDNKRNDAETANDRIGFADLSDTKLSSLPSTGGIGTTIFTIGGCLIMIVAAGLFFATRKKSAK